MFHNLPSARSARGEGLDVTGLTSRLRIILAIGTLYLLNEPYVRLGGIGVFRLFDVEGTVAIAGLGLKLVVCAIRNTCALYLAERLPRSG